MKRSIFNRLFAVGLITGLMTVNSAATAFGNSEIPLPSPTQQEASLSRSSINVPVGSGALEATQEQMDFWARNARSNARVVPQESNSARSSWRTLSPFNHYLQTPHNGNSNTCGIAAVRMIMDWETGSAPTQAQIINSPQVTLHSGGTFLSELVDYLHAQRGVLPYIPVYGANQSTMSRNLNSTIRNSNAPFMIGVSGYTSQGFPRNTGNHMIVGYGVWGNGEIFALTDPALSTSGRDYQATAATLHRAYSNTSVGYAW